MYTYVLTTNEYGTIDMMITTISLLLPFLTLGIYEGTLRFTVKSEYKKEQILSSSIIIGFTWKYNIFIRIADIK